MLARNNDPTSSHEAADGIVESGKHAQQKTVVLAALRMYQKAHGPATSAELARHYEMDRHVVAKRLSDLEKAGMVVKGGQQKCSISGKKAISWEVPS